MDRLGVPPLKWAGSDVDKFNALAETFVQTVYNNVPNLKEISYDIHAKRFVDLGGNPVTAEGWAEFADSPEAARARAGESSLRRAVFLKSLMDSESRGYGEPGKVLGNLLAWGGSFADDAGLRGLFSRQAIVGNSGRSYTPEQKVAMERTGSVTSKKTLKESLDAIWQDAGKKLAQGIVDQFAPVKDIDAKAYTLMRLSKGAAGAFEALMHHGKLSITDGATDCDTSGGVLERVFYPIGKESTDFLRWVAGNRAERLMKEGKEHLFTQDDIDAFKSLSSGDTPHAWG